jgi:WD40 repeat protein
MGQLGMGAVFAAEDPALGRRIAMKIMRPDVAVHADGGRVLLPSSSQPNVRKDRELAMTRMHWTCTTVLGALLLAVWSTAFVLAQDDPLLKKLQADSEYGELNRYVVKQVGSALSAQELGVKIYALNSVARQAKMAEDAVLELFKKSVEDAKSQKLDVVGALDATSSGIAYRVALENQRKRGVSVTKKSSAANGKVKLQLRDDEQMAVVRSVSFSPDGKSLASGGYGMNISIWDAATGTRIGRLDGHTGKIDSVCFSPDAQTLASGSWDKSIRIWDTRSGKLNLTLQGHAGEVHTVSFSPNGKILASGSWDNTVKLWELGTGTNTHTLVGHKGKVTCVSFSPDGKTLASGSWDKTVKLWDVAHGANIATLDGLASRVNCIAFSPNGSVIACGNEVIEVWDVVGRRRAVVLDGNMHGIYCLAFGPDGRTLASGGLYKGIKVWDLSTSREKAELTWEEDEADPIGQVNSLAFSRDGKLLAFGAIRGAHGFAGVFQLSTLSPR